MLLRIRFKSSPTYDKFSLSSSLLTELLPSYVAFGLSHGDLTIFFIDFLIPKLQLGLHDIDLPLASSFGNSSWSLESCCSGESSTSSTCTYYNKTTVSHGSQKQGWHFATALTLDLPSARQTSLFAEALEQQKSRLIIDRLKLKRVLLISLQKRCSQKAVNFRQMQNVAIPAHR